jgi:predicted RecA/RadA family phage recombinase
MAIAQFKQNGRTIDYANSSGSTIDYGEVTVINDFIGIAGEDILNGATGSMHLEGVFEIPAASGDTFSAGDPVYWNASTEQITATPGTNAYAGIVTQEKTSGQEVAEVKIGRVPESVKAEGGKLISKAYSEITLGPPTGTTQTATVQIKDIKNANIEEIRKLRAYMADGSDDTGATKSTTGANTSAGVTTGTELLENAAKLDWDVETDASGQVVFTFDNDGGGGAYTDRLVVVIPHTGELLVSDQLNVAAA